MKTPLALLLLATLGLGLTAQAAETVPAYEVEVIVFRQWEAVGPDGEWQPRQPMPPSVLTALAELGRSDGFQSIPTEGWQLSGIRDALSRSDNYQVLLHTAWRQPGLPEDAAPFIPYPSDWRPPADDRRLASEPDRHANSADDNDRLTNNTGDELEFNRPLPEPGLRGIMRLYRGRFLHFGVDLRYAKPEDVEKALYADDVPVYVMKQRRKMRSGEIHYLDHPLLGVIVQTRLIENAEAEQDAE